MILSAKGTKVSLNSNQILNATEIALSGTSWATETITSHNSTVPVEEITPTIRQDGTATLTLTPFLPSDSTHTALRTMSTSGATDSFTIAYPSSSVGSFSFTGFVQAISFMTPVDGIYSASVTIQPVAAITDVAARVLSVSVTDTEAGVYVTTESMTLAAVFDETVVVTGTPRISIVLTSGTVFANYTGGSGTNTLAFSRTFVGGDGATATHVSVSSPIGLNGGTILDMAGNAATLTFTPPNTATFRVN